MGYTELIGVSPKVQPMFVSFPKESLGYTARIVLSPKVQPRLPKNYWV